MKGDISIPFVGLIVTLVVALGILIPTRFMSVPTTRIVKYEQEHNNAQMVLISLLSSTENGKTIQELIGEYLVLKEPNKPDKDGLELLIKQKLDKLVDSGCYTFLTSKKELLVENSLCTPKEYKKEVEIPLPYNSNKLTEKLTLVID